MHSRRFSRLLLAVLVTAAYFIGGKLGLKLASLNASASAVWPPSGIALAALLLSGYRLWPAIFVGAFLVNLTTAGNLPTSLAIAVGNTLEAVSGAWLIHRFAGGLRVFDRAQGVFKFTLAVLVSTLVSPTLGITSLALAGFAAWPNYGAIWVTWWLGDIVGDLVIGPLILLWSTQSGLRFDRKNLPEAAALLILLILLAELVFGGWVPSGIWTRPISFFCGPILIWTAFRFTQRETATGLFVLSAVALWGTIHGHGPFVVETQNHSLLILQTWAGVLTLTSMTLAAAMAERRQAEAALERQKAIVEAANQTKDNFLAMLSHELRTPLTPVLAALDGLKSRLPGQDELKSTLSMMQRNIELESQLIDDLLDLTGITKGKLQLQLNTLDAHQAVTNVVQMCAAEANAKKLQVRLELKATEFHVKADLAKFQQIIWNLLKNAIKFTSDNGTITLASANHQPNFLTISVIDTGIGIEPEAIARIFNPFEQGERSFERRFGGLGLGLAISKSLAHAHGASLTAKSDGFGRGATFLLTMRTADFDHSPTQKASASAKASRPNLRVLLVDDHSDTCAALEKLLTLRGHQVSTAHNMRSAMTIAEDNQFDILITDVGLPDGNGMDLLRYLRSKFALPAIAISGFGMDADREKSIQAGFSEHLVKPVNLERLEAAIERVAGVVP